MPTNVSRFIKTFAKNMKSQKGPARYTVSGLPVICQHCQHDTFEHGEAQLNTAMLSFLDLDFANRSANILICSHCGYVHWFYHTITKLN